jgi:hypothetical protein
MIPEKFLYVLLYRYGKFFNCKRGHTLETWKARILDLRTLEESCDYTMKAIRGRIALPKHLCEIQGKRRFRFASALGVRARPRVAFLERPLCNITAKSRAD